MKRLFQTVAWAVLTGMCFAVGFRAMQSLLPPPAIEIRIKSVNSSERFA